MNDNNGGNNRIHSELGQNVIFLVLVELRFSCLIIFKKFSMPLPALFSQL